MFEPLIASSGGRKRRAGGTVVSLLVHAMVVAGAVHATERVVSRAAGRRADTRTFVVAPARKATEAVASTEEEPLPAAPVDAGEMIPAAIPSVDIPAMDVSSRPFDVTRVVGRQADASIGAIAGTAGSDAGSAGVYESAQVDDPATALSQPAPRYPAELERAGVHGYVELEYVIDSTGHAEPGSIWIIASSHAAFATAALEAILKGVYRPARYRGVIVRQLVRQRVVFGGE